MKSKPTFSPVVMVFFITCVSQLSSCLTDEKNVDTINEKITITTDKLLYHNEIVNLRINNNSDEKIYLLMYNSAFRDKLVNNEWQFATKTYIEDPGKDTVIIDADHSILETIFTAKPAIYRVGIPFLWNGDPARKDTVYSNDFEIY